MASQFRPSGRMPGLISIILCFSAVLFAPSAFAEGMTLNQCANGGITDPVDHLECHEGWISGNANKNKAAYREGEFLPYRVILTGLTTGSLYTYEFSWDTLHSGKHALDYIGTFNHNVSNADACQGLSASLCTGTVTMTAIPADPGLGFAQIAGQFTLFGGTLSAVAPGDYTAPGAAERGISVSFTPDQTTVILAWGGHIASPIDWGNGNTASDINGSPYHTQNKQLRDFEGNVVASGGQDVQLSAAAVFVPANITVTKIANLDETFEFESYVEVSGVPMDLTPDGEVNPWILMTGESKTLTPMETAEVTISETGIPAGDWRLASITCSELGVGEIFSYVYLTDPATDTAVFDVDEAGTYECVFENEFFGAPILTVIKKVVPLSIACADINQEDALSNESLMIYSGETVRYCYWVKNTGSDNALDVTIVDDMGTLDTGDDQAVLLSGGCDIGGDALIPDLCMGGGYAYGELTKQHLIANGTTVTNVATAEATGETDGETYSDTDDASVTADEIADCTLTASVTTGTCPGAPNVVVLEGDSVNWCAYVTWDSNAILDLTNIYIELAEDTSVNTSPADMSPGDLTTFNVGSKLAGVSDFNGTLVLTGSEGGLNDKSCQGSASVDVIHPGLQLTKLASLDEICGNADDSDMQTIFYSESIWYCLTVENTGDVPLEDVLIDDDKITLSNYDAGNLAVGESKTFKFGPFQPPETVTNTASATATEPQTGTEVGPEYSSATVEVLAADIEVDKDVEPGVIVICPEDPPNPDICTEPNGNGNYDAVYTITVTNNGPSPAFDVSVEDELPEGFIYDSDDGGCVLNVSTLECFIGDMLVDEQVVITVWGEIDPSIFPFPWMTVRNQACANPVPPTMDPDPSNNCDSDDTDITTGPTRTIGYWGSHPHALNACMDIAEDDYDGLDLGFVNLVTEKSDNEVDAMISTSLGPTPGGGGGGGGTGKTFRIVSQYVGKSDGGGVSIDAPPGGGGPTGSSLMAAEHYDDFDSSADSIYHFAKGLINANPAKWKNHYKRSSIDMARIQAGRQLTAAWCNEEVAGAIFADFFLGWDNIRAIMAGEAYLDGLTVISCGGTCDDSLLSEVISSIQFIASIADLFNNSGDSLPAPIPPAPADPHAPEDDPTDPSD
jgi:hypothetical protein